VSSIEFCKQKTFLVIFYSKFQETVAGNSMMLNIAADTNFIKGMIKRMDVGINSLIKSKK